MRASLKVDKQQLVNHCNPSMFPFQTTAEIDEGQAGMIGQERAVKALEFGLQVQNEGYNLFITGQSGSGRTTFAKRKAKQIANEQKTPLDLLYVHNFKNPDHPRVLQVTAGEGTRLQAEIERMMQDIKEEIGKVLKSKAFERRRIKMAQQFEEKSKERWEKLEEQLNHEEFTMQRTQNGIVAVPMTETGEAFQEESFKELSKGQRDALIERSRQLTKIVNERVREDQREKQHLQNQWREMEARTVREAIGGFIIAVKDSFSEAANVQEYLDEVELDIITHWREMAPKEEEKDKEEASLSEMLQKKEQTNEAKYRVHVLVDHSQTEGAPVINELNPSFSNVFGRIDHKSSFGTVVTDMTMIKSGSFHKANGGYLIMQVDDVLRQPHVWQTLKRVLKTGELRMESPYEEAGLMTKITMKPEPVPVNVKLLLIGTAEQHQLLYRHDPDFRKLFKVKVDFQTKMERNKHHQLEYASFVASFCNKEQLRHLTKEALAHLIDYSSRLVGHQEKMSTRFHEITEVLVEANYWAEREHANTIENPHIKRALEERRYRSGLTESTMQEAVEEGNVMISTSGEQIGQINGLVVLRTGNYSFGLPHRVTARTYVGQKGIVNIDRESLLTGPIHTKGLYILSGYLQGEFAFSHPIPLGASITFEQSYNMIDGDSASSTELYALLSSISRLPIRQDIAVTGSVNQFGEIQPIGGVNEKIEGFFAICKERGLTGDQGVMIPKQNIQNLMLAHEVVEAIENDSFTIWAVESIKEGFEILTGVKAGNADEKGRYPEQTGFGYVQTRIDQMFETLKTVRREQDLEKGRENE
ncbi:Lon protease family protein [Salsuginibacillus kocurii]|uniref:Lon protease family protein n=1 Tax=Salsuginibacillus kocurii TaxID=427078 RepID=UPI00036997FB|nr:ATP-binding protein [Salsuginibacillus kocurii]